jgi:hypothetical protein
MGGGAEWITEPKKSYAHAEGDAAPGTHTPGWQVAALSYGGSADDVDLFGVQFGPEVASADVLDLQLDLQTFEDLAPRLSPLPIEDRLGIANCDEERPRAPNS